MSINILIVKTIKCINLKSLNMAICGTNHTQLVQRLKLIGLIDLLKIHIPG